MRGIYQVVSQADPRWNKTGRDFICIYRGALNFCIHKYIERMKKKFSAEHAPWDLRYFVFWEGDPNGQEHSTADF